MVELNEYECEMLDAMLEAFGIPDSLTRNQLLELFDHDEATAFAMVQILLAEGLVGKTGKHGDYDLPGKLVLKPKGEQFLKAGGFSRRFQQEQQKPVEVGGTLSKLQQQNMKLQNEKLVNQTQLRQLEQKVNTLRIYVYVLLALVLMALILGYVLGHAVKHK